MRSHFRRTAYLLIAAATWLGSPLPRAITAAPPTGTGASHSPQCRDGQCSPHCPVRPTQFGYYRTQWRRWPDLDVAAGSANPTATTPAPPPRSVVPRSNQESASSLDDDDTGQPDPPAVEPGRATPAPPPQPASPRRPDAPPGEENLFDLYSLSAADEARFEKLAREARAAAAGDAAAQGRFTEGLIAVILIEHDPRGRCRIVRLAGTFDTPAANAICVGALQDPDSRVRMIGCQVCGARGGDQAIAALVRCLEVDKDPAVRLRACAVLAGRREEAALAALRRAVDDADPQVRSLAATAVAAKPIRTPWPSLPWAKKPDAAAPGAAPPGRRF